ncbi:hypothetical protein LINGRAHAP2_LOCUS4763 [Linum grandiflorum]
MASSFQQWEADPLFSAAEVVQDSADRMESLYRLLLHDQNFLQEDHSDPKLLTAIDYHRRDLVTILETAKWQLEDFERAVNSSAMADKSRSKEDVVARHRQFITAIREQIKLVETRIESPCSTGRKNSWVNLNEQDRDGLALFLSGGSPRQHSNDSSVLRKFLNPTSASSLGDDAIVEQQVNDKTQMNGDAHRHHGLGNGDVDRNQSARSGSCGRDCDEDKWDLEAGEAAPRTVFHENKLRGVYSRTNLRFLRNFWTIYGNRFSRSQTKRLKDGEEQMNSPMALDVQDQYVGTGLGCGLYSRIEASFVQLSSHHGVRYQLLPCHLQVNRQSVQMILTIVFALVFLAGRCSDLIELLALVQQVYWSSQLLDDKLI